MSRYVEKEPIIEFITKGLNNPDKTKAFGYDAIEILTEIEYAPIADVVEVVRCKDCVFAEEGFYECDIYCKLNDVSFGKDSFCSYGERK